MTQKNHIEYAQAKGASGDSFLPYPVFRNALARWFFEDLASDAPLNIAVNAAAGLIRVHAKGGAIFMAAHEDVTKDASTRAEVDLDLATNPTHGDWIEVGDTEDGGQRYNFKTSLLGASEAILTLTGAIVPGVHAVNVLTVSGGNIVDGDTVTIGARVYTWVAALTGGTGDPDEVLIGVSDATALDNLKSAINATAGAGTEYGTGTVAHADVVAITNDDTTQAIQARVPGVAANSIATTETGDNIAWADTTLGGGTGASVAGVDPETVTVNDKTYSFVDELTEDSGATAIINQILFGADSAAALDNLKLAVEAGATEGTNYSTGTEQPTDVSATTNDNTTQLFVADTAGAAGNVYPVSTTIANGSFGEGVTTFEGGYNDDGMTIVIGNDAAATQLVTRAAINGTGTAGTDYSTALVANDLATMDEFAANTAQLNAQAAGTQGNGIPVDSDLTAGGDGFSAATFTGGSSSGNFDAYIASGETLDFALDEDVTQISFIAEGASTDIIVLEY